MRCKLPRKETKAAEQLSIAGTTVEIAIVLGTFIPVLVPIVTLTLATALMSLTIQTRYFGLDLDNAHEPRMKLFLQFILFLQGALILVVWTDIQLEGRLLLFIALPSIYITSLVVDYWVCSPGARDRRLASPHVAALLEPAPSSFQSAAFRSFTQENRSVSATEMVPSSSFSSFASYTSEPEETWPARSSAKSRSNRPRCLSEVVEDSWASFTVEDSAGSA